MGKTIIEKVWERHKVYEEEGKPDLLYIDLHLIHEVTSPQAFEGLRLNNRKLRRPDLTYATMDHNIPTKDRETITDKIAKKQIDVLVENCNNFGVELAGLNSPNNGIVHIIGPELGLTQPGKTIVCGDSHTSTHGAFGALAFGIGTSEVEHVMATQTLWQDRPKTMEVVIDGRLENGVSAKDIILALIAKYGVNFGTGHVVEYRGEAIRGLTMEERMTICNMSIEGGARAGLISPDQVTFDYLRGREHVPDGDAYDVIVEEWKQLASDPDAKFDSTLVLDASEVKPMVTWGTNPGQGVTIDGAVPSPEDGTTDTERRAIEQSLEYMGLEPGTKMEDIKIQHVFLGSCTNARISDLREAARYIKGKKVDKSVRALVVPGSVKVKRQAEEEGLATIFIEAGFEWRDAGCSMCLGMNPDQVPAGERCASTSNRNFEGRQGKNARTHLMSPIMAAAAAVHGHFVDVRKLDAIPASS
ncbi:3-isopropylmalate/(R)-2-methylmalate dehydratase large subunit [Geomicrobium sediminis]|uniref:3-isopropylmalate dehydratase large subunit n=2 Tax=Geomicrobium sediminis TaxID=1347788 RepID=A0ABS2P8P9_9BACL|nr:3-isopropylmalate dehydratase large subunit [Geomicrobium sediminis]MBM7631692.1 3-isopropylmalate/(R)-2-methylmalate dehydratase large subunit [Geomicrobium sediminis]